MKRLIALFAALVVSAVSAQTVQTTPNLITSGTTHTWTGVTTGSLPTGCATAGPCPGGPAPIYDPATNMISFSYNANATVAQTIAINNALANAGAGVKINGYEYKYDIRNMNGDNRQSGTDTINVYQALVGTNGTNLLSSQQTYNTKFEWQTITGAQIATTPIELANASKLSFKMVGGDNGYWGGYFGPQVRNINMALKYSVDPCATNPAYDPSCANYSTVQTSNNLVPNPNGYAVYGSTIDNSYAINQALSLSGSNVMIHGFQWGYQANANGPYCNAWDIFGCWGQTITPSVTTNVNITDNTGASLYSVSRTYTNSYNTTNYQYVFPSSKNLSTLGNFKFTASTYDAAYIGSMWSKALYTPDPCTVNPLSSTTCLGYQQAYTDQQCSINPLYSTACAGYQAAYLTQQCSANSLYSPSCPGYAQAYQTQQCSINPLYSVDCPGYRQAYHDQQCSLDPLYANDCSGYQQAYFNQQCSLNPLYDSRCNGYAAAYKNQQCNMNPLYDSSCPGYAVAYKSQQCSLNPLYATDCPGYQQAYFNQQCSISPLYNSMCPGYATAYKTQQCTANPLYATDCPGYTQAYKTQQCNLNSLYSTDCPGYATAYKAQQCSLNPLYATDCPGYAVAYKSQQCSISPLYATDCPGYDTAYKAQQCTANPLYATDCPGYDQAYLNAQCIKDSLYSKLCTGYATAYAIKYLVPLEPGTSSAVNSSLSTTAAVAASNPASVNTTGTVSTTGSSTVDNAITAPSTTSATSTTSVTSVIAAPSTTSPTGVTSMSSLAAPPPPSNQQGGKQDGDKQGGPQQTAVGGNRPAPKEPTQQQAQAKAKAANENMKNATKLEDQVAAQGAVVGAMAFVPGFAAYQEVMVPDINQLRMARQYSKPPVDNNRTQRMLGGAQEKRWAEMVDSQYNNYNRGN